MNGVSTITQIRDALSRVNQKVNLIGFVREFSFPRKSLGTDYVSILKIVDESYREDELSVQIFTSKVEDLPLPRSYKDFIVLYQVKIREYNGRIYAVFNKMFSSYALFDEKSCLDFNPYQASPGFLLFGPDMNFVRRMGHLCPEFPFSGGRDEYLLSLKDFRSDKTYFDLVCKVILVTVGDSIDVHELPYIILRRARHLTFLFFTVFYFSPFCLEIKVLHVEEVSNNMWMFFVWDGNDTPPLSLDSSLIDEELNPLPLQVEQFILPRDVLCTFPSVGTVLRVKTDKAHEKFSLNFKGIGKWVRFRNMTYEVCFGLWNGLLTSSSRVRYLPDNHTTVLERIRNFNQRNVGEEGRTPSWSSPPFSTVVDYENAPFLTMMDILTQPKVGSVVKCIVRVVAVCPPQATDFSTTAGTDQHRMRLTLEDPTARIHATLCGDDWVTFFGGCFSADVIATKMNNLLGVTDKEDSNSLRSPPWIKCCIKVNCAEYHICGTRLV